MSCPIVLNGITVDCKCLGGIKEIYVIDALYVTGTTLSGTTGIIASIGLTAGKKFSTYSLRKEVGSMESTINSDDAAGTISYETSVTANFAQMTAAKRLEIMSLAIGSMVAIVKDSNDKYWYLGYDYPVVLTAGGGSTGTALTDANQYTITLTDKGKYLPFEVTSTIISALLV